jgi:hypothetical protein
MRACLAGVGIVLIGLVAAARGAEAPVPAEVAALKGKAVRIWHDVDLVGTGKPSPLHTAYLVMVLEEAGAKIARPQDLNDPFNARKPDLVIFGEMMPPPKLDPEEARDPFMAAKVKHMEEAIAKYHADRPSWRRMQRRRERGSFSLAISPRRWGCM